MYIRFYIYNRFRKHERSDANIYTLTHLICCLYYVTGVGGSSERPVIEAFKKEKCE